MKPTQFPISDSQQDLFRSQLENMINLSHNLVKLSKVVNWDQLNKTFGKTFCPDAGRPGISTRLMVALHYLKYALNLSDEDVVEGWVENPYWQYFSGMKYFQHELPIHPTSMNMSFRYTQRV
jgi:IS5 family transposase